MCTTLKNDGTNIWYTIQTSIGKRKLVILGREEERYFCVLLSLFVTHLAKQSGMDSDTRKIKKALFEQGVSNMLYFFTQEACAWVKMGATPGLCPSRPHGPYSAEQVTNTVGLV